MLQDSLAESVICNGSCMHAKVDFLCYNRFLNIHEISFSQGLSESVCRQVFFFFFGQRPLFENQNKSNTWL